MQTAPGFRNSIVRPRASIAEFEAARQEGVGTPWNSWLPYVLVAVIGSTIFGASLALVVPNLNARGAAVWLTLSAGLAWCAFGPTLLAVTRKPALTCAHACLVTIAYGEFVLICGAILNAASYLALRNAPTLVLATYSIPFNFAVVGASNVVMASTLAMQLEVLGVSAWRTLFTWVVVLNGVGALLFWGFYKLIVSSG